MYRGNERIEAAAEFIDELYDKGIPYLFLTNNSSKTPLEYLEKLTQMQIKANLNQIVTSSLATAKFIKLENPNARCLVIGEAGLKEALTNEGLQIVSNDVYDYVVIGLDQKI